MPTPIVTKEDLEQGIREHKSLWSVPNDLTMRKGKQGLSFFYLRCRCGDYHWVRGARVKKGTSRGCRKCMHTTHGKSYTQLYKTWHDLKKKNRPLCPSWQSYPKFEQWASRYYEPGFKLIRIDLKADYSPQNCDYVLINKSDKPVPATVVETTHTENLLPIGWTTATQVVS